MSDLRVGSTVWVFDPNRREYTKPADGRVWGELIYRGHFRPTEIVGETRVSWVLRHGTKINKKTLDGIYPTESDIDDACWLHDNAHEIAERVRRCKSIAIVKQIQALLETTKR